MRDRQPLCRPDRDGNFNLMPNIGAGKVQGLVGAQVSYVEFKQVSGVAAIEDAHAQLNARLAARGAPCPRPVARPLGSCQLQPRYVWPVGLQHVGHASKAWHASGTIVPCVPSVWPVLQMNAVLAGFL